MATLSQDRIAELIHPFYPAPSDLLVEQLSIYLELLLKWNKRMNLTAIRDPEQIVSRHFGESLFTAAHLPKGETLLDLGSGAGFPGLPIQLALPNWRVTLAESQRKKSLFLSEVVRSLGTYTEVWHGRVEDLPELRRFDVVTWRAVDQPGLAAALVRDRVAEGGVMAHLTGEPEAGGIVIQVPGSRRRYLHLRKLFHVEQFRAGAGE